MLMSLDEIRHGLDNQFLSLEPMLQGYRLVPNPHEHAPIAEWASNRELRIPDDLLETSEKYDLGALTIGPVTFGSDGNYARSLEQYNQPGTGLGPDGVNEFVAVAISDPYVILVNTSTGKLFARDSETGQTSIHPIASTFDQFLRGLGTVFLLRNRTDNKMAVGDAVATEVGAGDSRFWRWLAS